MNSKAYSKPHPDIGTELIREWAPSGDPRAYVVLVHGLAEHSGRYERTGSLLADAGLFVRSFDLIGAGGSGGRRWDIDEWGRFHDQIASHVVWAKGHGRPVVLMGHSLGGNLCLGYALSDHPAPDLLILSTPALAGGKPWQRLVAPILAKIAPTLALPNAIEGSVLSRDPAVGEACFADPMVVTKTTVRFGAKAFDELDRVRDGAGALAIPTLVFHGGEDRLVPTESSEILGEIDSVDRRVYEGLRHETLNEPEGPQVVADVVAWIDAHL
jgi:alpha-beta hydrolase superfamily lysophospholipase